MALFNINEDFRVTWYPKSHLTAADLGDGKGGYRTFKVKIKRITVEMLMKSKSQKKEPTPVAYFEVGKKYLILSNAVCKGLFEATGSSIPKDWIGKEIELWVETGVRAFGSTTDQVRVRRVSGSSVQRPSGSGPYITTPTMPEDLGDDEVVDEHDLDDDEVLPTDDADDAEGIEGLKEAAELIEAEAAGGE